MIFEETFLSTIKLKNRILRSATNEGMADNKGFPTNELKAKYVQLAQGGVGAIITGYSGIQHNGKGNTYNMLMIDSDEYIPYYKGITEAVHEYNTSIILQISHSGRQTRSKIIGQKPVAPSAIKDQYFNEETPKELTEAEIFEIIDNFVSAIVRAKKAGFDGVQLHTAHGYLLAEFLSNNSNKRRDNWGGSLENRFRIIKEIFTRAKVLVGDYPVLIKINAHDGRRNGMRIDEAIKISKLLEECGCAGIEVSCGTYADGLYTFRGNMLPIDAALSFNFKYNKLPKFVKNIFKNVAPYVIPKIKPYYNYNVDSAQRIKQSVRIPVIVVGGINSIDSIRNIINTQKANFVSMCRPFIIEPNIVNKFKEGTQQKSKCIECNYCGIAQEEKPFKCYNGKLN